MSAKTPKIGDPQTLQAPPALWYCMACHINFFWNLKKCILGVSCKSHGNWLGCKHVSVCLCVCAVRRCLVTASASAPSVTSIGGLLPSCSLRCANHSLSPVVYIISVARCHRARSGALIILSHLLFTSYQWLAAVMLAQVG